MNMQHLRAILWLRWRMSANQWRRGGRLNAAITSIFVVGAIAASVMLFFITLIGGSVLMIVTQPAPDTCGKPDDLTTVAPDPFDHGVVGRGATVAPGDIRIIEQGQILELQQQAR